MHLQRKGEGPEAGTQLLDYLFHATATGQAQLRGGSAMLGALCSAAQRSADTLEAAGLPGMALEALSMARALCSGTKSLSDGPLQWSPWPSIHVSSPRIEETIRESSANGAGLIPAAKQC